MFYYCDQLISVAPNNFIVTPGDFDFVEVKHQNLNRQILTTQNAGAEIHIIATGASLQLNFHIHDWCGPITVVHNKCLREIDLFHFEHDYRIVEFLADSENRIDIRIFCGLGKKNLCTKALQTWLVGVHFSERQAWMPKSLPISDVCEIAYGKRGNFIVHSNDSVIGREIIARGIWAEHDIEFFEKKIKPGMVVFDIGTNIGHHLVVFSKLVGAEGLVVGFEPQKVIYRIAISNVVINECDNAEVFRVCLGDTNGVAKMFPIDYKARNNFGALGVTRDFASANAAGENVVVRTLDAMMADELQHVQKINFIKIDVQSYELFVLKGGLETLNKFKPDLFLEIAPYWMQQRGYDYKEIYKILADIGYSFSHAHVGAGVIDDIRQWNGVSTEEWDVYASVRGV
jgi:FkbM family methyltransferase